MYGLLGHPLSHSFSKSWFEERGYPFQNFDYATVEEFLATLPSDLQGFTVTIPHKEAIIPYLSEIDPTAKEVGAVNCVTVRDGKLKGYNTDIIGFTESLRPHLTSEHKRAAVLGSGGASKAVQFSLRELGIDYIVVSRSGDGYDRFDPSTVDIIVNTTPLGMFPNVDTLPPIDYSMIRRGTICYDLVYNPTKTAFMELCSAKDAIVIGGLEMLHLQAEAAVQLYLAF